MRVFISWSGRRSQVVAEALRDWLVRVIQRLEPWVSTEDIRAGARWQTDISGVLATTKFGILCLTPESLESRWLNFEAGALAKTIDNATFVCPYLIGLGQGDVPLPIGQFQAKTADYEGTKSLVLTINSALGEFSLPERQLEDSFETYWPRLRDTLDNLPQADESVVQKRDTSEVLDEILSTVRGLARQPSSLDLLFASELLPALAGGSSRAGSEQRKLFIVSPCTSSADKNIESYADFLLNRFKAVRFDAQDEKKHDEGE